MKTGEPASFRACSGSSTVEIADNQAPGVYRFTARVVDAAGNVTDVSRDFTIAATLEAALTANGGKLPGSDGTGALAVLPVTLAYDFAAKRNGTRFSALTLKRIPSGASVRVTCTKGCPRKTYKPTKLKSTLQPQALPEANWLKPGAVLTVTVSKPGAMTMIKRFTIRRSQASAAGVAVPGARGEEARNAAEHGVGELRGRGRARQDEVGRAAQQRLDLGAVAEDLRELGVRAPVGVVGAGAQALDQHRFGRRQQDAVVERQVGLLLRAAGEAQQPFGVPREQVGDRGAAPAPAARAAGLAEAVIVGVVGGARRAAAAPRPGSTSPSPTCP